jgi:ABC-type lipoprotein release transport system permease subunit
LPLVWALNTFGLDMTIWMDEGSNFDVAGVVFDSTLWPRVTVGDVAKLSVAIFAMTALAGVWPAARAARVQPTEALRAD